MRIPTRKIWRAFPELDRFSDTHCARFVKAACTQDWHRHLHALALLVLGGVLFGVVFAAASSLMNHLMPSARARLRYDWFVLLGILLASTGIPALVVLLVRDHLLLGRVRRVLLARGSCPACRYSLLGIPVNENNIVTCPECGMQIEADPSLNELISDEQGRRQFLPTESINPMRFWTPRRKKIAKRLNIAAAIFIFGILPALGGGYTLFLHHQAKLARQERPDVAGVLAFIEAHQEPGVTPDDVNAFDVLDKVLAMMAKTEARVRNQHKADGVRTEWEVAPLYYEIFQPTTTPPESMTVASQRDIALGTQAAVEMIAAYRKDGVFEALDALATTKRAVYPPTYGADGELVGISQAVYGDYYHLEQINTARMVLAWQAGDTQKWLATFETNLALSRAISHQPFLTDQLWAMGIEQLAFSQVKDVLLTHPDPAFLDEAQAVINRQRPSLSQTYAVEGDRLLMLDQIATFYADPKMSRVIIPLSIVANKRASQKLFSNGIQTYHRARDVMNAYYNAMSKAISHEPWEAFTLPLVPNGNFFLSLIITSTDIFSESNWNHTMQTRGLKIMIALERFYNDHHSYPASLDALVPDRLNAVPIDPWSGKPFLFRLEPGTLVDSTTPKIPGSLVPWPNPASWRYTLYSVGPNGIDDGGHYFKPIFRNGHYRYKLNPDMLLSVPPQPARRATTHRHPATQSLR